MCSAHDEKKWNGERFPCCCIAGHFVVEQCIKKAEFLAIAIVIIIIISSGGMEDEIREFRAGTRKTVVRTSKLLSADEQLLC